MEPMDAAEIKAFLDLVMFMGMARLPQISDYWSTYSFYKNNFIPKIMSRNRFETILRMLNFANNETEAEEGSRLYEFKNFVDKLERKFVQVYEPGAIVTIDESLIPFRGRLNFLQYNRASFIPASFFLVCYTYTLITTRCRGLNSLLLCSSFDLSSHL